MTLREIGPCRLAAQGITTAHGSSPAEVVAHLGAMQAQDYLGALWGVGLRLPGTTEGEVEQAIANREIVRTWPMRGTLHFVAAADVRWMLKLMTPRIVAGSAGRHRQLELDEATFKRSEKLLVRALKGGQVSTRGDLFAMLERNRVDPSGQRGIHILSKLAMQGVLCFGPREGKQPTFVLLDDWVPESRALEHDEAIAEIARRYFMSHGPATVTDFVGWTGLKVTEGRQGLEAVSGELHKDVIKGVEYWMAPSVAAAASPKVKGKSSTVHLLPGFDEFVLGYKDRTTVIPPEHMNKIVPGGNGMFMPTIVSRGQVVGLWKRTLKGKSAQVECMPFGKLTAAELKASGRQVARYGEFLGVETANS
ncbi:winged helix DNA-binding domain-containing protein [Roseimicrobium sp. ORNL1]|uniref:winged helix DNA-binding domain-containing protein n=1 Tax=Roseimicrobium sp. ORNL1 TaxID=2711231 RepID=UPI0013E1B69F|nr:winged helix DNA-binding domain-containing protein [Roseimicrobium sp. ORNL1]QIF02639.1 winged helix DNA-binding domain-containing protein [Roseimicrobium sp. ORNL1]